MEWNFKDGIPIYTQIIDEMTMRIASSAYEPGDKLPSVRDLAACEEILRRIHREASQDRNGR